jgi:YhcH/YjgK/YiaL family protein
MAVFAPFAQLREQVRNDPRFAAALDYAAAAVDPRSSTYQRILALPTGAPAARIELAGGAFALEQAYLTRVRADCFFESHRKYIDLQLIVAGEEIIEVADISRLQVTAPFAEERDLVKYGDTPRASPLRLRAGDAAVFFPEDGHMPCLLERGPVAVWKTVVKVPVARA